MEKRCFSLQTKDFEDCLQSYYHYKTPKEGEGSKPEKENKRLNKLMEVMHEIEKKENDPCYKSSVPIKGKTLHQQNDKNIYSLEIGYDRAMAVIVEQDKKKIYVWFWVGSHEEYSSKLKADLKRSSTHIQEKNQSVIKGKIEELRRDARTVVPNHMANIDKVRQGYRPQKAKIDKKYR